MTEPYIIKLLREHPSAPRWRSESGEELGPGGLERIRAYEAALLEAERDRGVAEITLREAVQRAQERAFGQGLHWRRREGGAPRPVAIDDLARVPTTGREVLAGTPAALVPMDADLAEMVVVRTSGTATGAPALVPHHRAALGMYAPLLRATLRRRGVAADFGPDLVGVVLVEPGLPSCAFPVAALDGAGFARVDLDPGEWRDGADAVRFVAAFAPAILTGPPAALDELARRAEALARTLGAGTPRMKPRAVFVTGGELAPQARERVERWLGAPTVSWYAITEVGPVAFGCKAGRGLHVLPPDLLVESLPDSEELAFTGGRNPYLPLVRYRPGDQGRIERGPCPCGDPAPRIVGLRRA